MPHDANGVDLQAGDTVYVPCTVDQVHAGEELCNVSLSTLYPMPPYTLPTQLVLNTKQVAKTIKVLGALLLLASMALPAVAGPAAPVPMPTTNCGASGRTDCGTSGTSTK